LLDKFFSVSSIPMAWRRSASSRVGDVPPGQFGFQNPARAADRRKYRRIPEFVGVEDDCDGALSDGVADPIDPGDQDEPARNALSLNRRHAGPLHRHIENNTGT
jgi:hypothetical protein